MDASSVERPVVGYIGDIREVDLGLIEFLSSSRPDWRFVLVGPLPEKWPDRVAALHRVQNVRFVGARPYWELRSYLTGFDVCLMPYARAGSERLRSHFRTYEYLVTGRSAISCEGNAPLKVPSLDHIARSPLEFQAAIEAFVASDAAGEARITLVDGGYWFSGLVEEAGKCFPGRTPLEVRRKRQPTPA